MANVELLRKLIREEVRAAFRDELAGVLKEALTAKREAATITENSKPKKAAIPGTLNTKPFKPTIAPNLGNNNPLNALLIETAQDMSTDDYEGFSYNTGDIHGFNQENFMDRTTTTTVEGMLTTARASSNLDAIQINSVPDFTELMSKMQANGTI